MSLNDQLADIFYGKGIFMRNFNTFINAVRKSNLDIPAEDVKNFYDNQTIVQVFKKRPIRINPKLHNVSVKQTKPFERIYGDTMFFTDKRTDDKFALICFMDGFTRYGYAYYVSLNEPRAKTDINDAVDALYEYLDLLEEKFKVKPKIFITDDGKEFAEPFVQELREEDIGHRYGVARDTLKNPLIERFNYTLRLMVEKFRTTYDKDSLQDNLKKQKTIPVNQRVINTIINKYNNLPTKATGGLSPNEAIEREKEVADFYNNRKLKETRSFRLLFPVGSWVRIALKKIGEEFAETIRQNWTTKVFKVERYDRRRNRYIVDGKSYLAEELQAVDKEALDEYDMFHKIVKRPKEFESDLEVVRKVRIFPKTREGRIRELSILKLNDFERLAIAVFGPSKRDKKKSTFTEGGRRDRAVQFIDRLERDKPKRMVNDFYKLDIKKFIEKYQ